MSNGHFSHFGPYAHDAVAELRRINDARNREHERQERAERWLVARLDGQTFHSFDALVAAAAHVVETVSGPMTDDERRILTNAARACFAGLAQRDRCQLTINDRGRVERLTFRTA